MKAHQVRGDRRAGGMPLAGDIMYGGEPSIREPVVPQEKFFLSKSQILVGSSQNAVSPCIMLRSMEGKTLRPQTRKWVIRRMHRKIWKAGTPIRRLEDDAVQ